MATNIINTTTGQTGYQVPGGATPTGWSSTTGANTTLDQATTAPTSIPTSPTGSAYLSPPSTINASNLGGTTPLNISAAQPSTVANGIGGASDATLASHQTALDKALQDKVTSDTQAKNESKNSLQNIMSQILGVKRNRATVESNANIPGLTTNANDAFTALQASKEAQRHEIEAIDKNPAGYTTSGMASAKNAINNKYASTQADLSISLDVANRNLTSAQSMVDKKISLELAPLQDALSFQTTFFNDNKDQLSKDEQNQLTLMMDENKQKIADKTAVGDVLKTAITNGVQLTPEQVKQVSSFSNANDAYSYLASQGISLQNPLDAQNKALANQKLRTEISNLQNPSGPAMPTDYTSFLGGLTPQQSTAFNGLPGNDKSMVAQLVTGDALLTDLVKSRGIQGTQAINKLINEAMSVDPTFSVNTNKVRYQFLQNWNNPNGKSSIMRNSINTSLGHLADFKTNADALNSTDLRFMNKVSNILTTETGSAGVLKVRTDIGALASEIATIYKNGVSPSETEIEDWRNVLAADFSSGQFQGVSDEISKLLSSKITATRYQYSTAMGREYGQPLIDPEKKQALITAGVDPSVLPSENVPEQVDNTPVTNQTQTATTNSGNSFDVQSAIKAGYTLKDIQDYLKAH